MFSKSTRNGSKENSYHCPRSKSGSRPEAAPRRLDYRGRTCFPRNRNNSRRSPPSQPKDHWRNTLARWALLGNCGDRKKAAWRQPPGPQARKNSRNIVRDLGHIVPPETCATLSSRSQLDATIARCRLAYEIVPLAGGSLHDCEVFRFASRVEQSM